MAQYPHNYAVCLLSENRFEEATSDLKVTVDYMEDQETSPISIFHQKVDHLGALKAEAKSEELSQLNR